MVSDGQRRKAHQAVSRSLEPGIHLSHPTIIEHVPDLGNPAALVEHEAMVVLGVDGERSAVLRVGQVDEIVEVFARGAGIDRIDYRVELISNCRCNPRSCENHHETDNRDDQDVLDGRLASQAAGTPRRYPPPRRNAATCICGSSLLWECNNAFSLRTESSKRPPLPLRQDCRSASRVKMMTKEISH